MSLLRQKRSQPQQKDIYDTVVLGLSSHPAFVNEAVSPAQFTTISRRKAAFIGEIPAFLIRPFESGGCRVRG
jgi:hypothetical protein